MYEIKACTLKLCHRTVSESTSTIAIVHKATTDGVAFSSMVVVGVSIAGLLRLKIPMMSYYAGCAKSRAGDAVIV